LVIPYLLVTLVSLVVRKASGKEIGVKAHLICRQSAELFKEAKPNMRSVKNNANVPQKEGLGGQTGGYFSSG
jgi:hypothetical protein